MTVLCHGSPSRVSIAEFSKALDNNQLKLECGLVAHLSGTHREGKERGSTESYIDRPISWLSCSRVLYYQRRVSRRVFLVDVPLLNLKMDPLPRRM